jgi:hypothetical protein
MSTPVVREDTELTVEPVRERIRVRVAFGEHSIELTPTAALSMATLLRDAAIEASRDVQEISNWAGDFVGGA